MEICVLVVLSGGFASWFFVWDWWVGYRVSGGLVVVVSLVLIVDCWNCFGYC